MIFFHRVKISTAIGAQLLGVCFLLMSLSIFMSSSDFVSEQAKNVYWLGFGLWLFYGFIAMSVSWLATLSLARSAYRQQVQGLCISGVAISSALLSLSCAG